MTKLLKKFSIVTISLLLTLALMVPNTMHPVLAATEMLPGEITNNKTATPVDGMVNTWDIVVDFKSRNHQLTSDIVLIMDVSGSMRGNKLTNTKAAAVAFVNALLLDGDTRTRIALVTYSRTSATVKPFANSTGKTALIDAINALSADGGTNIQAGLRTGRGLINTSTADLKTVVLLSDGAPTYSYAINDIKAADRTPFGASTETIRGIDLNRYNTSVLAGDGSTNFRSNVLAADENTELGYYYNHSNAALTERDAIVGNANIYTVALELTGEAGLLMKALASTEEHAYVAGAANVGDVYNKIAGGIRNNTSNVKIVDPIAKGFELVPNTLQVSPGSASVSGKTITWLAGDPSEEYFSGRMTYRVRAVDSILELTESEIYPTNDRTVMSYMSNTGATVERVYTVPTVKPTFITYEKQLTDDYGENVNDGGYVFDVGTKKDAYDKTYQVKPGSAHKVKTVEIYDYGTYVVSEKASTFNGLNNPLTNYTQGIKINGVDAS